MRRIHAEYFSLQAAFFAKCFTCAEFACGHFRDGAFGSLARDTATAAWKRLAGFLR
jgi:hypothetical protein